MTDAPWHRADPPWVVAEVGVNHDGSEERALQLVDAAAAAGADAVKFQTFDVDALVAPGAPTADYQRAHTHSVDQAALLRPLQLPAESWPRLAAAARARGLAFLSTAFDVASLRLVESLEPVAHKVPSGELTNLGWIERVAALGRPLLLSTGMATLDEVRRALGAAAAAPAVAVLHCVSAYPAPEDELNLRSIPLLAAELGVEVGWSDHSLGPVAGIAAVALGATVVERHLTLDRSGPGPDHAASVEPDELATWIGQVRAAARALGSSDKRPAPSEADVRRVARRSWHAARDLGAGEVLSTEALVALRPADGIGVDVDVVGRRLRQAVVAGHPIRPDDIEEVSP